MVEETKSPVLEELNQALVEAFEKKLLNDVAERDKLTEELLALKMQVEPNLIAASSALADAANKFKEFQ